MSECVCLYGCVCVSVMWWWSEWLCAGRFYSLCVSPFSLSPPHVIVFCINPLPSLRASRRLVRSFFSFVTPLFQKTSLYWNREKQKKKKKKVSGSEMKWYFPPKWRELISLKLLRWWSGLPTQQSALTALWGLVCRTFGIAFTPRSMFSAWYDLVVMETHELED